MAGTHISSSKNFENQKIKMGVTSTDIEKLEILIKKYCIRSVIELGAQNNYSIPLPAPYMSEWYRERGIEYESIDLSAENGCLVVDLSKPYTPERQYDMVTDFGTSEHVGWDGKHDIEAIYNCWKTKHDLLKVGGIMVNENPKTGNWIGHGFNYYTLDFYNRLTDLCGYAIIETCEIPAMGNTTDGWNVYCSFIRRNDRQFITLEEFKTCGIKLS
mgnify:CR=1 FL=1